MPKTIVRYCWRYHDPVRGRNFTTKYHCTEEEIRGRHPDAVAVENTREELVIPDTDEERLEASVWGHGLARRR